MKKLFTVLVLSFTVAAQPVCAASELSKIQAQIKQTEQQNKKLEQQVKTSDRDVAATKKKLVKAADQVSLLEEQRSIVARKIKDLDAQQAELERSLKQNQGRIADAAASILFIASHPSFDSDNMREYVLTSAVLSGAANSFDAEIQEATEKINELEKIQVKDVSKIDNFIPKYELKEYDVKSLAVVPMHNNAYIVGVIVIENYREKTIRSMFPRREMPESCFNFGK